MFKNESWSLKEWIEHYKLHGADHVYLVDDFSDDDYLPILQPYIDSGYVTLFKSCLLYTSPSPRDWMVSRMPSSA